MTVEVVPTIQTSAGQLLAIQAPIPIRSDIQELVTDLEVIAADLSSVAALNDQFPTDAGRAHADANIVRNDLGLSAV